MEKGTRARVGGAESASQCGLFLLGQAWIVDAYHAGSRSVALAALVLFWLPLTY